MSHANAGQPPTSFIRAVRFVAKAARRAIVMSGGDRVLARIGHLNGPAVKLLPTTESFRRGSRRRVIRNGIALDLDPSDYTHWLAYFDVEAPLKSKLYGLAGPGDVAIDVGTNLGEVLLSLARAVGPRGRAIGFEANPATYKLALGNIALNPHISAELHPLGLGDTEATLDFGSRSSANSGADSIVSAGSGQIKVPVIRLDKFVTDQGIERVNLIKIDTEGYDLHVLKGAEATIDRFSPKLFVEVCDANLRNHGDSAREILRWLEDRGYRCAEADAGDPVTSDDDLSDCFFDIIAIRAP